MEHIIPELSVEQRRNLTRLAKYLLGELFADFTMRLYCVGYAEDVTCGTAGCAIRHGPYAGIEKLPTENWEDYAARVFIKWNGCGHDAWNFCFASKWECVDNSPQGAARRIAYVLERGCPVSWDCQQVDFMLKSYTPDWERISELTVLLELQKPSE